MWIKRLKVTQEPMTKELIKQKLSEYNRKEISSEEFPGFRRAGVLVPLFRTSDGLRALLTVRTESVETHKGQISFPGGMMDEDDRDIVQTALREACEEIGLSAGDVEVLGILDDVPVPSGFIITPVVGYLSSRPFVKRHEIEVAEVLEVPLAFFAQDENARTEEREFRQNRSTVWFYQYKGRVIWGATAAMLRTLAKLIS